jgi:transposase-like protein
MALLELLREGGRVVSVAAIIASAVNADGRREILGLGLGPSEAATFWLDFLRGLQRRGRAGGKLVISDAHEGLKAAIKQVFQATWQRRRVHGPRNFLAYVPKGQHSMVAAAIRSVFAGEPSRRRRGVAPRCRSAAAALAEARRRGHHRRAPQARRQRCRLTRSPMTTARFTPA